MSPIDGRLLLYLRLVFRRIDSVWLRDLLNTLTEDQKQILHQNFSKVPQPLLLLLVAAAYFRPSIIMDMVNDFRGVVNGVYWVARAVQLKRMEWNGPASSRPDNERRNEVSRRDDGCVLTGMGPPSVIPELVHIIPLSLGKFHNGFGSPFYRGIRLLLGDEIAWGIFEVSGGVNVNSPSNLFTLAPTLHQMLDNGEVWLDPSLDGVSGLDFFRCDFPAENHRVTYTVRFRYQPEENRHTTVGENPTRCVELKNGHTLARKYQPGDPRLHAIMNVLYSLSHSIDCNRGKRGAEEDLGQFFN